VGRQFRIGDTVRLSGLTQSTVLNGAEGQVEEDPCEAGRYKVKISSPPAAAEAHPTCRVKPSNMELVQPGPEQQQHQEQRAGPERTSDQDWRKFLDNLDNIKYNVCLKTFNELRGALDNDAYPGASVSSKGRCVS
jgi:hypothetical protein